MRKSHLFRWLCGLSLSAVVLILATGLARAQFTQNRDTIKVDSSAFPPDIQKNYRLFRAKCGECHGLDTSLKLSFSSDQWSSEVKRMQAMASSQFNDKQAAAIIAFLDYYEGLHKSQDAAAAPASSSDPVAAGRDFYFAQSCDACHSIGGKGGDVGPHLDDVGRKLSRKALIKRMRDRRAGTVMPPLPGDTTDAQIDRLVDYLLTLKGG